MPSQQVIDFDALLAPISEEAPAGSDPRADSSATSLYYRVKDARNAARAAERSAVDLGGPVPEEWATVVDASIEVLSLHAKDLEIAAWMIEGLTRIEGFAGLRDGIKVMTGIVNQFWGYCFPELDEDGIEGKVSAVAGLSGSGAVGTLIQPVRLRPITQGSQWNFSYWSYAQAIDLEKVADPGRRKERIDNGAVSMEQFLQSVAETPAVYFGDLVSALDECLAALAEMSAAFDAVAGVDAPPVSALRDLLQEIVAAIRHLAASKLASIALPETAIEDETQSEGGQEAEAGGAGGGSAAVRRINGYANREEALAELVRIAGYFRSTEPNSPTSYSLEGAIRRARMTLPELLGELVEDPSQIQRMLMAAGIRAGQADATGLEPGGTED